MTEADLSHAPPGFLSSSPGFRLHAHEARELEMLGYPSRSYFHRRLCKSVDQSDALCFNSFKEMEREFGDYISTLYQKPVLWAGVVAKPYDGMLEPDLEGWLKGFNPRSVVYCALGSENVINLSMRLMAAHLKVGVEIVKREEDGFFTKEDVCKAILAVMELESEGVGKVVRANHEKWKDFLLKDELEDSYINDLVGNLQDLMGYD
uniref:Uncharacterized protein n=1 Tax=Chenopodium quinoa TaxID=63459 RepID=A0A803MPT4_CHEQI